MTQLTTSPGHTDRGRSAVLPIVMVGVLLSTFDLFIVNVALPDIGADVAVTDLGDLSWVLNAYAITFAALLVPAGRLGDMFGNKQFFLVGMVLFVVASALCGTTSDLAPLVGFRVAQAVGAAMMIPSSLALVMAATPADRRAGAVRLWAALGGLGAALGPVVGGILVEASWRWVFLVNVPIGLVAAVIGVRVLPRVPGHRGRFPDLVGTLLLVATVSALVAALVNAETWGWAAQGTLGLLAAAAVAGALFVATVVKASDPVVDLALLRAPHFSVMALNSLVFHVAFGAMLLSAVLWLQQVWGWSAIETGLGIAPGPVVVPVVAVLAGRLIARIGAPAVIALGGVTFAAGVAWWALAVDTTPDYVVAFLPGMVVTGIGVGLAVPAAMAAGTAGVPQARFATGSAVLTMARQIGLALGVAVLVAVLGTGAEVAAGTDYTTAWWVTAAIALAAGGIALADRDGRRTTEPRTRS